MDVAKSWIRNLVRKNSLPGRLIGYARVSTEEQGTDPQADELRAAGCDVVLYCNGKLDEMRDVASQTPELSGRALQRARAALAARKAPRPFDRAAARAELDALVARLGAAGA